MLQEKLGVGRKWFLSGKQYVLNYYLSSPEQVEKYEIRRSSETKEDL